MSRHVGRVKLHRGVARPSSAPAPTTAMPQPPKPQPVFVDDTGRRRRRVRLVVLCLGALVLVAVAVIWVNQSAGPVRPAPVRSCESGSHQQSGCGGR